MPKVKQLDWGNLRPKQIDYMKPRKPKHIKIKRQKRSKKEMIAIKDYYSTIEKIRDIL